MTLKRVTYFVRSMAAKMEDSRIYYSHPQSTVKNGFKAIYFGWKRSLEKVQRKAARFCINQYGQTDSVTTMLSELGWPSLADRRKAARLSIFSRAFSGDPALPDICSKIIPAPLDSLRNTHPYRVQSIPCRKTTAHNSFLPRTIREWNSLPPHQLKPFKSHISLRGSQLHT